MSRFEGHSCGDGLVQLAERVGDRRIDPVLYSGLVDDVHGRCRGCRGWDSALVSSVSRYGDRLGIDGEPI